MLLGRDMVYGSPIKKIQRERVNPAEDAGSAPTKRRGENSLENSDTSASFADASSFVGLDEVDDNAPSFADAASFGALEREKMEPFAFNKDL